MGHVDDSEIPNNHLECKKNCKYWDELPTSTGDRRISLPSTVSRALPNLLILQKSHKNTDAQSQSHGFSNQGKLGKTHSAMGFLGLTRFGSLHHAPGQFDGRTLRVCTITASSSLIKMYLYLYVLIYTHIYVTYIADIIHHKYISKDRNLQARVFIDSEGGFLDSTKRKLSGAIQRRLSPKPTQLRKETHLEMHFFGKTKPFQVILDDFAWISQS